MPHAGEQAARRTVRWTIALVALLLHAATPLRAQPTVLVPRAPPRGLARGTAFRPPGPPPANGFGRTVGGRGQTPFGSGASLVVGAPLAQGPGGVAAGRVYLFSDPYDSTQVTVLDSPSPSAG